MNLADARGFLIATHSGQEVIPRMKVATSFWLRAMGLMGKSAIPAEYGAGLFFPKCTSLHTCFMKFPLDILFLDAEGQVLAIRRRVRPWTLMVKGPKGTRHCLEVAMELPKIGGEVVWESVAQAPPPAITGGGACVT